MIRVALDSNILAYLAGVCRTEADEAKIARVREVIAALAERASLIAPAQALGELFVVLRRAGTEAAEVRAIVLEIAETLGTAASEARTISAAADLVVDHRLQFWDALIVTAAADAGCTLLLSEDMQHGFVVRGMTIVDPLRATPHAKLAPLVQPAV